MLILAFELVNRAHNFHCTIFPFLAHCVVYLKHHLIDNIYFYVINFIHSKTFFCHYLSLDFSVKLSTRKTHDLIFKVTFLNFVFLKKSLHRVLEEKYQPWDI